MPKLNPTNIVVRRDFLLNDMMGGMGGMMGDGRGWKEMDLVGPEAEILAPFAQAAPHEFPFMILCHILDHEDVGMMKQHACV